MRWLKVLHVKVLFNILMFQLALARPTREGGDGGGGGGSSCAVASGIGAFLGTVAFFAGLGSLATPVGSAAWLGFTAASLIFGIPATGISIGTAIGCPQ